MSVVVGVNPALAKVGGTAPFSQDSLHRADRASPPERTPESARTRVEEPEPSETGGELNPETPERARAQAELDPDEVDRLGKRIEELLARANVELRIQTEGGYEYVAELVDRTTGEVLRRIPPGEFQSLADAAQLGGPGKGRPPLGVLVDREG